MLASKKFHVHSASDVRVAYVDVQNEVVRMAPGDVHVTMRTWAEPSANKPFEHFAITMSIDEANEIIRMLQRALASPGTYIVSNDFTKANHG